MTHFGKKSLIWLIAGSLVAASGAVAWRVTATGAKQAQDALLQVERSETDLATLKTRLLKWEKAHPPGSLARPTGVLRIEPVALTADFSPHEFTGIQPVLTGMYIEHGSLKLKSLALEIGAGGAAHLAVLGDKVFVQ
jgi:hypothetical protein